MNAREQFGKYAANYVDSVRHARGAEDVIIIAEPGNNDIALDVGTGAGHTAHALARHCRYVLATDVTPEMLAQARRLASELGLTNVDTGFALAECLPYADASVDIVTSRLAAHHFSDVGAFCREMRRVLKTGGRAVINDIITPEDPAVADFINDIEVHRDHSHVEDLKLSRWRRHLEDAGLEVVSAEILRDDSPHELTEWTERAGTPSEDVDYIRARLGAAPDGVVGALELRAESDTFVWRWQAALILARRH